MEQTDQEVLWELYSMFPNIEQEIINDVAGHCKHKLTAAIQVLTAMFPPHNVSASKPPPKQNDRFGFVNSWLFPQPSTQKFTREDPLPNEYIHNFNMKQGHVIAPNSSKPIRYEQVYVDDSNYPRKHDIEDDDVSVNTTDATIHEQIYVNQPYYMKTNPIQSNKINKNDFVGFSSNQYSQRPQNKDTIQVDKDYQKFEQQIMTKVMDFVQNQMQMQQTETETKKDENKPILTNTTADTDEDDKKLKRQEELNKLKKLQEDVNNKLEENKEAMIKMFDNFKGEMQDFFAEKMKILDNIKEDDKLTTLTPENVVEDDNEPGPSFLKNHNARDVSLLQDSPNIKDEIITSIKDGYKIMVLMRGLPGSGKSFLASSLLYNSLGKVNRDEFIFSVNDYYKTKKSSSADDATAEDQAKVRNHRRCFEAMKRGVSPIIIDNNNLKIDEMKLYSTLAVMFGYMIEILEPQTPWALNPEVLAQKNTNGINEQEIKEMMKDSRENITVDDLKESFGLSYKDEMPQYRKYPKLSKSK